MGKSTIDAGILAREGDLLSSLVDSSPVAITTLDLNQKVTLWNPAAEEIFGWRRQEVLGKDYPLVPEEERAAFEALFRRVVVNGEGFHDVEVKRQRKDGSYVTLNVSTAPLRDSFGNITGALALMADLTEQRQLEEQVRHAQKMEAVGRLAGGVAHDFNNLLTVILANSQLLGRQLGDADRLKSIRAIEHCAERARDLVQQLLTFSRREIVNPKLLDLSDLARDTVRMLRRTLGNSYQLSTNLSPDVPPVRADAGQIEQVLLNLVVNARDAMPNGGHIDVRTSEAVRSSDAFGGRPTHFVCLTVSDSGDGIDPDVVPHIFEPFFTTKRAGEGTGLGLATVYGIVTRAGGTIEVDSNHGHGTTFRVLIPAADGAAVTGATSSNDRRAPNQAGGHMLVVDDDAGVLDAVAALIRALGYRVTAVQSGREALALIATGRTFDAVLTDVYMPEMTGRELADRLAERLDQVPILYMSANLSDAELRARVEAGTAHFLAKPLDFDEVGKTLRDVLSPGDG